MKKITLPDTCLTCAELVCTALRTVLYLIYRCLSPFVFILWSQLMLD